MKSYGLALAAIMALAAPAGAQQLGTPPPPASGTFGATPQAGGGAAAQQQPAPQLQTGEVVSTETPVGQPYVRESHGDWQVVCIKAESGPEPCQIRQTMFDTQRNAVSEITMYALSSEAQPEVAAGATIITPLQTLLTERVGLTINEDLSKRYDFQFCDPNGCVAQFGLTAEEVQAMRDGSRSLVRIVPVLAPDQPIVVNLSLSGFTAAFEALGS
ncbi:MAG: invasion associated locus B family protein [Rhodobacteraceae bacterium]|nr:invasion associated locus B family protein [Paracoccaceae bacterium]